MNKLKLREIYKTQRNSFSAEEINLYSHQIFEKLKELDIWHKKVFHVFLSMDNKNEVKTNELIEFLHENEKTVVVPKINLHENELMNCRFLPSTDLIKNEWGISEPEFCRVVHPQKIEVVFIPLLISDTKGNRVGYGKGFYDKLLSNCTPETIKIGLNFFEPIQEVFGVESTDIPLNYLVTPKEIFSY